MSVAVSWAGIVVGGLALLAGPAGNAAGATTAASDTLAVFEAPADSLGPPTGFVPPGGAGLDGSSPEDRGPGVLGSPFAISLHSLALPGLGQARNGAWLKSVGFLGAWGVYLGWGIGLNQDVQDARGAFHAAPEEEAADRLDELEALEDRRNGKFWTAGFIALLAMADAYVDAHLKNFDERIDADLAVWDTGAAPAWGLTLTMTIDDTPRPGRRPGRTR